MQRTYSFKRDIDSFVAAIAGFLIIHAFTHHSGIGLSPDSVVYMSTAANIRHHAAINDFTGTPMMDFPAFYPLFLSGVMFVTGLDPLKFAPVLNGLLFAGLIFLCGWLMERFLRSSRIYKWILLSIIVLSPCLLEVYSMLWSETLFIFLSLLFILPAHYYFKTHRLMPLVLMGIITAMACVTRYAGISLVLLGGLLLLIDGQLKPVKKLVHLLLFGLLSISLFLLNIYRNRLVTGTLTGYREKAVTGFWANLYHLGTVFCDWLPFFNKSYGAASVVGAFFILFCFGLLLCRYWKYRAMFFSYESIGASYFVVYSFFILLIASISRFQQLDSRLLSPLFIPWLWASSSWVPGFLAGRSTLIRRLGGAIGLLAAACLQAGQYRTFKENWEGIREAGIPGYAEDQWTQSPTMDFLRHNTSLHQPDVSIYSNAFEGIWFFTGIQSDIIPHKDIAGDIKEMMAENDFYVVWFFDSLNKDLITVDYIRRYKTLVQEDRFEDGVVYHFITPAPGSKP